MEILYSSVVDLSPAWSEVVAILANYVYTAQDISPRELAQKLKRWLATTILHNKHTK